MRYSIERIRPLLCGLGLRPANPRAAVWAVLLSIVGTVALVAALDLAFRDSLPESYVSLYTQPLVPRMFLSAMFGVRDEVVFRLIIMTSMIMVLAVWRGQLSAGEFIAVIALSQFLNVGVAVMEDPLYAGLRFWAVGCIWGWLYWRHGFISAVFAHATVHLILDPVLKFVLLAT